MRWPSVLLPVLLLTGCFGPPPDCRPSATAGWDDLAVYDALGAAGVKASAPAGGLEYNVPDLDSAWRAYVLRDARWAEPFAPDGVRDRGANMGGISQVQPGSRRVLFTMAVGADQDAAAVRAFFYTLVEDLSTADASQKDRLFAALDKTRQESAILHPDDPARRTVEAYGYAAETTLPLRLSELDADLSASNVAENTPMGIGHAMRRVGPWSFNLDLPVRSTDVQVAGIDVVLEADASGRGRAVARPVDNATDGQAAILAVFDHLGIAVPAFGDAVRYEREPLCGE